MSVRGGLTVKGLYKRRVAALLCRPIVERWLMAPYWPKKHRHQIVLTGDPVRYGSVDLALEQLLNDQIQGALTECGVYQGAMSKFIHERIPDRPLFLFDTFEGFDTRNSDAISDERFKDTSEDAVLNYIGDRHNIVIRRGFFPDTLCGLENELFAFVMIDFDKYEPTLAALEFFYPRTSRGGFIFVHDFNSPESGWACSKALNGFLANKPEKVIPIPDA